MISFRRPSCAVLLPWSLLALSLAFNAAYVVDRGAARLYDARKLGDLRAPVSAIADTVREIEGRLGMSEGGVTDHVRDSGRAGQ